MSTGIIIGIISIGVIMLTHIIAFTVYIVRMESKIITKAEQNEMISVKNQIKSLHDEQCEMKNEFKENLIEMKNEFRFEFGELKEITKQLTLSTQNLALSIRELQTIIKREITSNIEK